MKAILIALVVILASCNKPPTPPGPQPKPIDPCQKANAGPNKVIKNGEMTEIGANDYVASATYSWFPASQVVSPDEYKTQVAPRQTTVNILKVKNTCGISFSIVKVKVQ